MIRFVAPSRADGSFGGLLRFKDVAVAAGAVVASTRVGEAALKRAIDEATVMAAWSCPEFCQVLFDNVRIPAENIVGGLNNGWTVSKGLLGFERLHNGSPSRPQHPMRKTREIATARGLWDDFEFRSKYKAGTGRIRPGAVVPALCRRDRQRRHAGTGYVDTKNLVIRDDHAH